MLSLFHFDIIFPPSSNMNILSSTLTIALYFLGVSTCVQGCGRYRFFRWWDLPDPVLEASKTLGYDFAVSKGYNLGDA
jgi:hypothetical protein